MEKIDLFWIEEGFNILSVAGVCIGLVLSIIGIRRKERLALILGMPMTIIFVLFCVKYFAARYSVLSLKAEIAETIEPTETEITGSIEPSEIESASIPLSFFYSSGNSNHPGTTDDICVGNWGDSFGKTYEDSLRFWVIKRYGWANREYIDYEIGGRFDTLFGTIVAEENSEQDACMQIVIYADNVQIYKSDIICYETKPIDFSVNIEGVQTIRVECTTETDYYGYCIVSASLLGLNR